MGTRFRWVITAAIIVTASSCWRWCPPGGVVPIASPECPDHDSVQVHGSSGPTEITKVRLAGNVTFIPEFHDCQRLLNPDGGTSFGPLAAVWVSENLAVLVDSLRALNPASLWFHTISGDSGWQTCTVLCGQGRVPPIVMVDSIRGPDPTKVTALPFAIIHAWNQGYPPLQIAPGWNCLYIFPALSGIGFESRMVHVTGETDCFDPRKASTLGSQSLPVSVLPAPTGLAEGDVPPVGRWDTDFKRHVNYIGLKCGGAWCEVTDKAIYQPSAAYTGNPAGTAAATSPIAEGDRVMTVKGWYDEQRIAVSGGPNGLTPAAFRGIVMPDSLLDKAVFQRGKWLRGGWAAIEDTSTEYKTKLNLARGKLPPSGVPEGGTEVWICQGDADTCSIPADKRPPCTPDPNDPWFFRMIAVETQVTTYKCVTRHSHEGMMLHVWGTARWAWSPDDEKLWFRCGDACCTNN